MNPYIFYIYNYFICELRSSILKKKLKLNPYISSTIFRNYEFKNNILICEFRFNLISKFDKTEYSPEVATNTMMTQIIQYVVIPRMLD